MYILNVQPVKNPSRALVLLDGVERVQSHTSVKEKRARLGEGRERVWIGIHATTIIL